eukprot:1161960-Pelagomonas_calceolata.AAC.6
MVGWAHRHHGECKSVMKGVKILSHFLPLLGMRFLAKMSVGGVSGLYNARANMCVPAHLCQFFLAVPTCQQMLSVAFAVYVALHGRTSH